MRFMVFKYYSVLLLLVLTLLLLLLLFTSSFGQEQYEIARLLLNLTDQAVQATPSSYSFDFANSDVFVIITPSETTFIEDYCNIVIHVII